MGNRGGDGERHLEDVVGLVDGLEVLGVAALVGVVLHGELAVGLLEVRGGGARVDIKQLVVPTSRGEGATTTTALSEQRSR